MEHSDLVSESAELSGCNGMLLYYLALDSHFNTKVI